MSLEFSALNVGDHASITRIDLNQAPQGHKLMMMGLTPGTPLSVVRVAPLGDPIEINIRGFNLSLRRDEAKGLWVKKLGEAS